MWDQIQRTIQANAKLEASMGKEADIKIVHCSQRESSVDDIPDAELLERAVKNAHIGRPKGVRWSHVGDVFVLGSTYASQLCVRYGLDPCEYVGDEEEEDLEDTKEAVP